MTQNSGTLVIAPIVPNDSADTYPSARAIDILGGWKAAADATARAAIPTARLEAGCACWQVDTGTLYRWDGAAWQVVTLGGGAATSIDLSTATITNTLPAVNIGNNTVSNAKLAQMPTLTIKGNNTGGTANALDLTVAQATAMLAAMVGDSGSGGTKGLVPAPGAGDTAANKFLRADGTWGTARDTFLVNDVRGTIGANSGRGLQYVSALDKVLYAESVVNGRIMAIDPKTDYPIPLYTSAKTPKGLIYTASSARIWLPNGTTDLFSVNPSGWTTDVASAGSRSDYLVYNSNSGTFFGFDNGTTKLREYNATTGAQIGSDYSPPTFIANNSDRPWVYCAANNSIYFADLAGAIRRFNCTSHAFTLLGTFHTGPSAAAGLMIGSDGLIYSVNSGASDSYKIKIIDPASDTVVATIDLSANLTTIAGFVWIYEWRGYLYAGCNGSSPSGVVCVVNMSTRLLDSSFLYATTISGGMAASPTLARGYVGCAVATGFTSYLAFDR